MSIIILLASSSSCIRSIYNPADAHVQLTDNVSCLVYLIFFILFLHDSPSEFPLHEIVAARHGSAHAHRRFDHEEHLCEMGCKSEHTCTTEQPFPLKTGRTRLGTTEIKEAAHKVEIKLEEAKLFPLAAPNTYLQQQHPLYEGLGSAAGASLTHPHNAYLLISPLANIISLLALL
ncbi:hypothetical protein BaRGS_00008218 [Batillaria attramentaria]|uniref:Uncharacterized protein n=1 Tax=Batillaria attramentaria TaxID=370345 RepID=A0ABD0LNR9_9CAEN